MSQSSAWEKEYRDPKLVTKNDEPQKFMLRYFKYLKKEQAVSFENIAVLDLGCGTGRNSNYLAHKCHKVIGIDISFTAIDLAKKRAFEEGLQNVQYSTGDIGQKFNVPGNSIDLVIDVTSSNSLNESERLTYLNEVNRVLKIGGHFFVRALCKDGDKNAKNLIKLCPGKENDTYYMKELGLTERVFTEADFKQLYSQYFKIDKLVKDSGYAKVNGRVFQRNYWLAHLKKV